jgi:hypothetical protein
MPIALSGKFTSWVTLPLDRDPAVDKSLWPAFEVRFLTELQARQMVQASEPREEGFSERRDRLVGILEPLVVGTRNMPGAGSLKGAAALELLVDGEIEDLAVEIYRASKLGYLDLKKSKSRPESGAASSAPNAEAPPAAIPQNPIAP